MGVGPIITLNDGSRWRVKISEKPVTNLQPKQSKAIARIIGALQQRHKQASAFYAHNVKRHSSKAFSLLVGGKKAYDQSRSSWKNLQLIHEIATGNLPKQKLQIESDSEEETDLIFGEEEREEPVNPSHTVEVGKLSNSPSKNDEVTKLSERVRKLEDRELQLRIDFGKKMEKLQRRIEEKGSQPNVKGHENREEKPQQIIEDKGPELKVKRRRKRRKARRAPPEQKGMSFKAKLLLGGLTAAVGTLALASAFTSPLTGQKPLLMIGDGREPLQMPPKVNTTNTSTAVAQPYSPPTWLAFTAGVATTAVTAVAIKAAQLAVMAGRKCPTFW